MEKSKNIIIIIYFTINGSTKRPNGKKAIGYEIKEIIN